MPTLAQNPTRPLCSITPDPRDCRIGNRVCPGGCIKPSNCPGPPVTVTSTVTSTTTSVSTSISTRTQTASCSISSGISSTSSAFTPACKTDVPYANLFTFPDDKCQNKTGILPDILPEYNGLVGPPIKFSKLVFNSATNYSESSCVPLPVEGGAKSIYFTVDGNKDVSGRGIPSCTINFYNRRACRGNPSSRYLESDTNKCIAPRPGSNQGPWRSAMFKCGYTRDLCTDNEILLGTCIKF